MQAGKGAMASAKEAASNVFASAKSGMDKTKATVQGQFDKMTAQTPADKQMAEERTLERKQQAEMNKQGLLHQNAADREHAKAGLVTGYPAGQTGFTTGHQNPTYAAPEHGTGYPTGGDMTSGVVPSDTTATGRTTAGDGSLSGEAQPGLPGSHGTRPSYT